MRRSLLLGILLCGNALQAADDFTLGGWTEVVVIVRDLNKHRQFFEDVGGWKPVAKSSQLQSETLRFWGLPEQTQAQQIVMHNPGTTSGFIRLVQFKGLSQVDIRPDAQSWDTGGIFDINVRITDMDTSYSQMQSAGWYGVSPPNHFVFGKFEVKEWIARGPDGLTIAVIERIKPTLEGWPELKKFSRTFNSTQVVANLATSRSFYEDVLGFQQYMHHRGPSEKAGANVLGLPHNITTQVEREVVILHPQGKNEGSVELLQFYGADGSDYSDRAKAPNIGMLTLRFPVDNMAALEKHLKSLSIEIESRASNVDLQPWGKVDLLMVRSPDGTALEFFQLREN